MQPVVGMPGKQRWDVCRACAGQRFPHPFQPGARSRGHYTWPPRMNLSCLPSAPTCLDVGMALRRDHLEPGSTPEPS